MKQQFTQKIDKQQGIALPTVMIILLLAALAALYTAQTSIKEQEVTADQYRSEQAFAAAQAGIDVGLHKHNTFDVLVGGALLCNQTGLPDCEDDISDTLPEKGSFTVMFCDIWDDDGAGPKTSDVLLKEFLTDEFVCTNPLTAEAEADGFINDSRVGILSVGKPDDDSGRRTISIISAPAKITSSDGKPSQPLISKSTVDITGTLNVINRYDDDTIWSAQAAEQYSSAVKTFINDGTIEPCIGESCSNRLALVNPDEDENTVAATEARLGQNSDIIDNDQNLANVTEAQFFEAFFSDGKQPTKDLFTEYTELSDLNDAIDNGGVSGPIWLADPDLTGQISGDLGDCSVDPPVPVVFVVEVADADSLKFAGGNDICGIVFVFGDISAAGSVTVSGAMISTGSVGGTGTFTIVYDPEAMTEPPEGYGGSRGVDAGTWKDWGWNG